MSLSMATLWPNESLAAGPGAVRVRTRVHVAPVRVYTCAAPSLPSGVTSKFGAPTMAVLPSSATLQPTLSTAAPTDSCCCNVHAPPVYVKTYAAPRRNVPSTVSSGAPAITVVPLIATLAPNQSNASACAAGTVISACWVHVVPVRTKMKAAPWSTTPDTSWKGAPTTAMSPLIATLCPKASLAAPPRAVSFCCCSQVLPLLMYTYAAPSLPPSVRSWLDAPTISVLPLMATLMPKVSPALPALSSCTCPNDEVKGNRSNR